MAPVMNGNIKTGFGDSKRKGPAYTASTASDQGHAPMCTRRHRGLDALVRTAKLKQVEAH